jgi:hypothetical protein
MTTRLIALPKSSFSLLASSRQLDLPQRIGMAVSIVTVVFMSETEKL